MPVPGDDITVVDSAKVGIVDKSDKPYRSPEHIAELNRRRAQIPQKWYPIALTENWGQYLKADSWLKVVYGNGDFLIGKLYTSAGCTGDCIIHAQTALLNDDLCDIGCINVSKRAGLMQAFSNDEAYSKAMCGLAKTKRDLFDWLYRLFNEK